MVQAQQQAELTQQAEAALKEAKEERAKAQAEATAMLVKAEKEAAQILREAQAKATRLISERTARFQPETEAMKQEVQFLCVYGISTVVSRQLLCRKTILCAVTSLYTDCTCQHEICRDDKLLLLDDIGL